MQFWHPDDPNPPTAAPPATSATAVPPQLPPASQQSTRASNKRPTGTAQSKAIAQSKRLQFLYALETHRSVIVHDPTADSTAAKLALPLINAQWASEGRCIAAVVSNEAAAMAAARAVASDRGLTNLHVGGEHVGLVLPHVSHRSANTHLVFFTSRSLLDTLRADPLLSTVGVVVVESVHTRSATTDLLLALLRAVQDARPELRLVLSTATSVRPLVDFCKPLPTRVIRVATHTRPSSVLYAAKPAKDFVSAAKDAIVDVVASWFHAGRPPESDVIVFVPTFTDVKTLRQTLSEWVVLEAQPSMIMRDQTLARRPRRHPLVTVAAIQDAEPAPPPPSLRILLATDVPAVPPTGIATVIDTGLARRALYEAAAGGTARPVVPISKEDARARAYCAAHSENPRTIRLYTREAYTQLAKRALPDLLRTDLSSFLVDARSLGVDARDLRLIAFPSSAALSLAIQRLHAMGSFGEDGQLTPDIGRVLAGAPVPPRAMRSVVAGAEFGVARQVAALCAMLGVQRHVFMQSGRKGDAARAPFTVVEGDFATLLNVWRRWVASGMSGSWCRSQGVDIDAMRKAAQVFALITRRVEANHSPEARFKSGRRALGLTDMECICRSVAGGYFENAAMRQPDGTYLVALSGRRVRIDESSVLKGRVPQWVVFDELAHGQPLWVMRGITVIKPEWLVDASPKLFEVSGSEPNL